MKILKFGLLVSMWVLLGRNGFASSGNPWVDSKWKCYSGCHAQAVDVTNAETVPLETFSDNPPKPSFIAKPYETPVKFLGLGLSPGMSITSEVITTYEGHAIYCFTCHQAPEAGFPAWTFNWAVLAGDVTTGSGPKRVRVFFVEMGDDIRSFSAAPLSTSNGLSGIEASQDIDGNGVEWDHFTLKLAKTGPWLVKCEGGGRHEPHMIFHYNRAGKVIKVEKDDSDQ